MKPAHTLTLLAATALLAAPVAATAQDAYGEKGWVEEVDAKSYVAETHYHPAPETYVRGGGQTVHHVQPVSYGCVMGMGVMQRGTLICPGH